MNTYTIHTVMAITRVAAFATRCAGHHMRPTAARRMCHVVILPAVTVINGTYTRVRLGHVFSPRPRAHPQLQSLVKVPRMNERLGSVLGGALDAVVQLVRAWVRVLGIVVWGVGRGGAG